jgi:hypothetical protein
MDSLACERVQTFRPRPVCARLTEAVFDAIMDQAWHLECHGGMTFGEIETFLRASRSRIVAAAGRQCSSCSGVTQRPLIDRARAVWLRGYFPRLAPGL